MLSNDLVEFPRLIVPSYSVFVTSHTYGASKVFQTMIATFPLLASEEIDITKTLNFIRFGDHFYFKFVHFLLDFLQNFSNISTVSADILSVV